MTENNKMSTISSTSAGAADASVTSSKTGKDLSDNSTNESCGLTCTLYMSVSLLIGLVFIGFLIYIAKLYFSPKNSASSHGDIKGGYFQRKNSKYKDSCKQNDPKIEKEIKKILAKFQTDKKYEFPRKKLHLGEVLGQGEFGKVLLAMAKMPNGNMKPVAVKMLKEKAIASDIRDLISEYQLVKDLRHRNLIRLIGICSKDGPFLMIMDYCAKGSLRSFLRMFRKSSTTTLNKDRILEEKKNGISPINCSSNNNKSYSKKKKKSTKAQESLNIPTFTKPMRDRHEAIENIISDEDESFDGPPCNEDLISIAWQISCGMEYLSQVNLVHRDLATRNVLLTSKLVAKISDFGLSRDTYDGNGVYMKESKGRVPVKWLAIESLVTKKYTIKSDVWSFGIVLWEIFTYAQSPYPGVQSGKILEYLNKGNRMARPPGCPEKLYSIMLKCWKERPNARPSFHILSEMLADMLRGVEYTDDENCDAVNAVKCPLPDIPTTSTSLDDTSKNKDNNNITSDSSPKSPPENLSKHTGRWTIAKKETPPIVKMTSSPSNEEFHIGAYSSEEYEAYNDEVLPSTTQALRNTRPPRFQPTSQSRQEYKKNMKKESPKQLKAKNSYESSEESNKQKHDKSISKSDGLTKSSSAIILQPAQPFVVVNNQTSAELETENDANHKTEVTFSMVKKIDPNIKYNFDLTEKLTR